MEHAQHTATPNMPITVFRRAASIAAFLSHEWGGVVVDALHRYAEGTLGGVPRPEHLEAALGDVVVDGEVDIVKLHTLVARARTDSSWAGISYPDWDGTISTGTTGSGRMTWSLGRGGSGIVIERPRPDRPMGSRDGVVVLSWESPWPFEVEVAGDYLERHVVALVQTVACVAGLEVAQAIAQTLRLADADAYLAGASRNYTLLVGPKMGA